MSRNDKKSKRPEESPRGADIDGVVIDEAAIGGGKTVPVMAGFGGLVVGEAALTTKSDGTVMADITLSARPQPIGFKGSHDDWVAILARHEAHGPVEEITIGSFNPAEHCRRCLASIDLSKVPRAPARSSPPMLGESMSSVVKHAQSQPRKRPWR